jgi:hypothetical protein
MRIKSSSIIETLRDADRLDLGHVSIKTNSKYLSKLAKNHIGLAYEWSVLDACGYS